MIQREILKANAKESIKGNIGTIFGMTIIVSLISVVINFIPTIGSVANTFFVSPAFNLAFVAIYLKIARGGKVVFNELFDGFSYFWGAFKINFLISLFTLLWSLLFVVPGIIKGYSYSMAMYIYSENRNMGALEAINKSKEIMEGHKMDLFVLELSFIGWYLLSMITFGIALIYVLPYAETTVANFYLAISGQPMENATVIDADLV